MSTNPKQRWFPSEQQLKDPSSLERSFRQLLLQHYELVDRFNDMAAKTAKPEPAAGGGPPPGSGPTDSQLLGLRVAPVDVQTLADGTKLTWVKKDGNLQFK